VRSEKFADALRRGHASEVNFDPARLDSTTCGTMTRSAHQSQRFEMEQLTAIVLVDPTQHLIAGYKTGWDEFWVPAMPASADAGVLMCERQRSCSYYMTTSGCFRATPGFGAWKRALSRHRQTRRSPAWSPGKKCAPPSIFVVQGFVGTTMVFHAVS